MSNTNIKEIYYESGYFVTNIELSSYLASIRRELILVFNQIAVANGLNPIINDEDIINLFNNHKDLWLSAFHQLRYLPSILSISNNSIILSCLETIEIKFPSLSSPINVRCDIPRENSYKAPPHQDYPYNQGSFNSVTIWIPLQTTSLEIGPLEVVPASHSNGAFQAENEIIEHFQDEQFIPVALELGQAIFFSQFLVHRSGENISDRIRFSIQIRFNDLAEEDYAKRNYYWNTEIKTKSKEIDFPTYFP